MNKNEVVKALEDMKRQIDVEEWAIYCNDRGSGSAGVRYTDDSDVIENYLHYAKTGDNSEVPHCEGISYTAVSDFDEEDVKIVDEILDCYGDYFERDEVLGLVVINEHFDMDYTFYLLHLEG